MKRNKLKPWSGFECVTLTFCSLLLLPQGTTKIQCMTMVEEIALEDKKMAAMGATPHPDDDLVAVITSCEKYFEVIKKHKDDMLYDDDDVPTTKAAFESCTDYSPKVACERTCEDYKERIDTSKYFAKEGCAVHCEEECAKEASVYCHSSYIPTVLNNRYSETTGGAGHGVVYMSENTVCTGSTGSPSTAVTTTVGVGIFAIVAALF